jgi:putative transposase
MLATTCSTHGVPQVMKRLGQRYVQHVNRTYQRTGPLFEGRFRSALIEADGYLRACQPYIELNPVRAGMVAAPGECPRSSYRANAPGHSDGVVQAHPHYQSSARRLAQGRRSDTAARQSRQP